VKTAAAARDPRLARIAFRVSTTQANVRQTEGRFEVVDPAGDVVFASGSALMWDSPPPVVADPQVPDQSGAERAPSHQAAMPIQVTASEVAVVPDRAMLLASDTNYPMFIDPSLSPATPAFWTHVNADHPDTSYYTSHRSGMRVGLNFSALELWRTHMQFNIGSMAGSTVLSARLLVTADHVAACAGADYELWETQPIANP
jgi:hypothetical protein